MKKLFVGLLLLLSISLFATLPTIPGSKATATNPDSALTDFTLMVDLSRLSPRAWALCDTTTGGYGRASKLDGTELATDFIDLNTTNKTGWLRVKWSGDLESTGDQLVRVWLPNTDMALYGASDTYGSDNAYDSSWDAYYPLGGGTDRTSNGRDGTATGSPTIGGTVGKVGNATDLNGSTQYISLGDAWTSGYTELSLIMWVNPDSVVGEHSYVSCWDDENHVLFEQNGSNLFVAYNDEGGFHSLSKSTINASSWQMVTFRYGDGLATNVSINLDKSGELTGDGALDDILTADWFIGASEAGTKLFAGLEQGVQIFNAHLSDDWISSEYSQTNDNATFWGEWTFEEGEELDDELFLINGEDAGTTPWEFDSITNEGSNVFTLDSDATHRGTNGYSVTFDGTNNDCYAVKAFDVSQDEVYVRGYVYIDSGFTLPEYQTTQLLTIRDGSTLLADIRIRRGASGSGVPTQWQIRGQDITSTTSTTNFSLGAWHCIEAHWKAGTGADGGVELWVDGNSAFSEMDNNLTVYSADDITIGTYWEAVPANGDYLYFDDIKASTEPIGAYNVIRYVNTDSTTGGTGTTNESTGVNRAYPLLNTWEGAEETDLTASGDRHTVLCSAPSGTADTTAVVINGWTTGPSNNIVVEAAVGDEALKVGWQADRYRLETTDETTIIINDNYVRIKKLQIKENYVATNFLNVIYISGIPSGGSDIRIEECRVEGDGAGYLRGIYIYDSDVTVSVFNTILNKCHRHGLLVTESTSVDVSNCIFTGQGYATSEAIELEAGSNNVTVTNCAVFNNVGDDYSDIGTGNSADYNASDDAIGTNPVAPRDSNWDNEFVDPDNGDFTLVNSGAIKGNLYHGGVDDPSGGLYTTDMEGDPYFSGAYSIGVDEAIFELLRYVDPDSGGTPDGLTWETAWLSLYDWEAAEQTNLVTDGDWHHVYCRASSGTADTTTFTIDGWTTDITHYVLIEAASGDEALKTGIDTSRYRLVAGDTAYLIRIFDDYIRFKGIQFQKSSTNGAAQSVITITDHPGMEFDSCYLEQAGNESYREIGILSDNTVTVINTVITGGSTSVIGSAAMSGNYFTVYNSIAHKFRYGIHGTASSLPVVNTAFIDYGYSVVEGSGYDVDCCASAAGTGTNAVTPSGSDWDNEYTDPSNGDFTLLNTGNCFEGGADNPSSGLYTTDMDGQPYNVGAYSVGVDENLIDTYGEKAYATWTNPASVLVDFSGMINLGNLPQAWWDAVNTFDGTMGRVSTSDGIELAADWIDFDDGAETGWLRLLWPDLQDTGTQIVWVFPPVTDNEAYASTHVYGSDNAYDSSWEGYWPLEEDPSGSAPQMLDRTLNSVDLDSAGTMTFGDLVSSQVANGLHFDDIDDYLITDSVVTDPDIDDDFTFMGWINTDDLLGNQTLIAKYNGSNYVNFVLQGNGRMGVQDNNGTMSFYSNYVSAMTNTFICLRKNGTDFDLWINSNKDSGGTRTTPTVGNAEFQVAGSANGAVQTFDGILDDFKWCSDVKSDDWISEEYSQTNDNATFWGTWAWSGGGEPPASIAVLRRRIMGYSAVFNFENLLILFNTISGFLLSYTVMKLKQAQKQLLWYSDPEHIKALAEVEHCLEGTHV